MPTSMGMTAGPACTRLACAHLAASATLCWQVGHAYVTGLLRWLLPSSATYQTIERALPCCLHSPSFIAHTAGSGGDAVLPTRHPHSGDGSPHSGWLQGPWMPFPPSGEYPQDKALMPAPTDVEGFKVQGGR